MSLCNPSVYKTLTTLISSLIRSSAMRNNIMIDMAFCESMTDGFGRGIVCKEGKSVSRVNIYSCKKVAKHCPSMTEVV